MRFRIVFSVVLALLLVHCGDSPVEPVIEHNLPSFATTTTEDGLSISTDKDDYQPGDIVHLTGSGWQPGDVLDIVLTEEPQTEPPHTWSVSVDENGMFHDSTYVVEPGDLDVAFTLVATSTSTGRSLTVNFTDGNLQLQPNPTPDPFSPNADGVKDATTIGYRNQGSGEETGVSISVRQGTAIGGTLIRQFSIGTLASNGGSGSVDWDGKNSATPPVVVAEGEYTIRIFNASQTELTAGGQRFYTALVDNTPPVISSPAVSPVSLAQGSNTPVSVTGTATDNPASGVSANRYKAVIGEYNIDGGAFVAMTVGSGAGPNVKSLTGTIAATTVQGLTAGGHLVCIRATDDAGNRSANTASGNSNCATLQVNANAVATTTTVTSSINPSGSGESVTFTAAVKSGSPATPVTTGQVTFKEGGNNCADPASTQLQAATNVNSTTGEVTFTKTDLAIGSHTIRACYGGATGFLASEGSVTQQVNNTATVTEIASSVNPSVTGQSTTFTATVKRDEAPVGAHGSVSFRQGSTDCTDGTEVKSATTLNTSGQATYSASFLASGSPFNIRACYSGSTSPLLAVSNAAITQNVNVGATSTDVSSSKATTVFGEAVTFDVTVSAASPASGTPAGNVTLKDGTCAAGSSLAGPSALDGSGKVSFANVTTIAVGSHTITACYAGNGDFNGSDGSTSQTVNKASTSTVVTSSSPSNTSTYGDQVTFEATVSPVAPGGGTPAGNVDFIEGGTCASPTTTHATKALSGGKASFDISNLSAGAHTIAACFLGNTNYLGSHDDVGQTVNKAPLTVTAEDKSKDYNGQAFTPFTVKYAGFVLNEGPANLGGTLGFSGTAVGAVNAGTYTITPGGLTSNNYDISFANGTLTINKVPLTVTADDKQKDYDGHAFTAFTAKYDGFVNNEGVANLTGTLGFTGTAVGAINSGTYTITPGGLSSNNYDITFANGALTINKVLLTVTAVNRQKVWDGQPYAFNTNPVTTTDVTYSGFVNTEGPSVLTGPLVFSAASQIAKGTYTNTPSGLSATNYNFSYVAGTLVIQAWTITGFFQPVDMSAGGNIWNTTKGGYTVPLKFRVFAGTVEKTDVSAIKSFVQTKLTCPDTPTTDEIEVVSTGGTTLRYDFGGSQFVQNWQTPKPASTCYKVTMTTLDDSFITALFKTR